MKVSMTVVDALAPYNSQGTSKQHIDSTIIPAIINDKCLILFIH